MTLFERYCLGESIQVYSEIAAMGREAFSIARYPDVLAVVAETMNRTSFNLHVIYEELERIKYNFNRDSKYSFLKPLNAPIENADLLLEQLDEVVRSFGYIPLTLKIFYKIVGGCNFAWDYETNGAIAWGESDPIQIAPLDAVLKTITADDWVDSMRENVKEFSETAYLDLSADYFHKDNISGGPAYALEITTMPSVDGRFLNEEHETTFVGYLRHVFEYAGFGRGEKIEMNPSYDAFWERVRPKLKMI